MRNPFRRQNTQTIAELENYYATRNNRTGMAWVMAFLSLLITVLVIAGLFFGGRWIYRTLIDNNRSDENTSLITSDTDIEDGTTTVGDIFTEDNTESATNPTDGNTDNNSDNTAEADGVVSSEAASTSTPNTDRIAASGSTAGATTTTTPTTGDSDLPKTGAGDILLLAPLLAVVAGYLFSRNRQLHLQK